MVEQESYPQSLEDIEELGLHLKRNKNPLRWSMIMLTVEIAVGRQKG